MKLEGNSTILTEDNKDDGWFTNENGKRFQIDTETNEVIKGNIGVSKVGEGKSGSDEITDTASKSLEADLKANDGNHVKAAHDFYRREFQGKHVVAKIDGKDAKVTFIGVGWHEMRRDMNSNPIKAALVPHLADIIKTGKSTQFVPAQHSRFEGFHYFYKQVNVEGNPILAVVDVGKRSDGVYEYNPYSLNYEGFKTFAQKIKNIEKATGKKITADDADSFSLVHLKGTTDQTPLMADAIGNIINNDFEIVHIGFEENPMRNPNQSLHREALSFDASTKRRFDDNGFMHVDGCHITKEQVAEYWGCDVPEWERYRLDPNRKYRCYRPADELEKAVETFNGLPLLLYHHVESAENPKKEYRVGSVGTSAVWNAPYIDNALSITTKEGIQAVLDGYAREISCAYQYDPDFTPGEFEGQPYDIVMRNIRGNHVALVEKGRAGPDVVVADALLETKPEKEDSIMSELNNKAPEGNPGPAGGAPVAKDEDKAAAIRKVLAELAPEIPAEKLDALAGTLTDLAYAKAEDSGQPPAVEPGQPSPADGNPQPAADPAPEIDMDAARAWDACGMDSDDPAVKAAFAKGFSWGMKDGEKDGKREEERRMAMDAAINARVGEHVKALEAKFEAAEEVGRYVGAVKAVAFDSATGIYVHGLKELGIPSGMYSEGSARDVFRIAVQTREKRMAQDNAPLPKFEGKFAGLNDIH